jgi:hypothetical protein
MKHEGNHANRRHRVDQHGRPSRDDRPPGLLTMEVESIRWRVAVALRRTNWRFSRIYYLQLLASQLGLSRLECRHDSDSHRRREYLHFKSQAAGPIIALCVGPERKHRCRPDAGRKLPSMDGKQPVVFMFDDGVAFARSLLERREGEVQLATEKDSTSAGKGKTYFYP